MDAFTTTHDGVTLAGERAGEGTPVVLLHGLTATRRYVVMGSTALERAGHRVLRYDARGHGASAPGEAYDYSTLAADLGAVMDAQGIERATLAGASMGAHTALRFALDNPQRVAGLVIVTPAFDPGAAPGLDRWDRLADGLRTGGVDGFIDAYDVDALPERYRDTIRRVLAQRMAAHDHPDAVADALQAVPRSRPFEYWADLANMPNVPTVVVASRDAADPEHPLATGERYADAIAGAQLRTEDEGQSPLAWQGGQLSRVIADVAEADNQSGRG